MSEMSFEQMLDESSKTIHNGEVVEGIRSSMSKKERDHLEYRVQSSDGIITRKRIYPTTQSVDLQEVVHVNDKMGSKSPESKRR